jgi:hypothetical protein
LVQFAAATLLMTEIAPRLRSPSLHVVLGRHTINGDGGVPPKAIAYR